MGDASRPGQGSVSKRSTGRRLGAIQEALNANRPAYPTGLNPNSFGWWGFRKGYYYGGWSTVDQNLAPPSFASGILECSLVGTLPADLPPRSYIAITNASPGVPVGYSRAREEASFHMVLGTY